jgi:hypothetical protein
VRNHGNESVEGLDNQGSSEYDDVNGPAYESPNLQDPSSVYGSLVGNDPHVYGSLDVLRKTPEEDGQVTCTLPKSEDTYQQLNPDGQQCNDEYETLRYDKEN